MPFHIEEYVRMIEVVLLKYYEKCYQRFYCKLSHEARNVVSDSSL